MECTKHYTIVQSANCNSDVLGAFHTWNEFLKLVAFVKICEILQKALPICFATSMTAM